MIVIVVVVVVVGVEVEVVRGGRGVVAVVVVVVVVVGGCRVCDAAFLWTFKTGNAAPVRKFMLAGHRVEVPVPTLFGHVTQSIRF